MEVDQESVDLDSARHVRHLQHWLQVLFAISYAMNIVVSDSQLIPNVGVLSRYCVIRFLNLKPASTWTKGDDRNVALFRHIHWAS